MVGGLTEIGYFIASKNADGSPGKPVGNEDGAVMVFDDLAAAKAARGSLVVEMGQLSIFQVNVSILGEVVL